MELKSALGSVLSLPPFQLCPICPAFPWSAQPQDSSYSKRLIIPWSSPTTEVHMP